MHLHKKIYSLQFIEFNKFPHAKKAFEGFLVIYEVNFIFLETYCLLVSYSISALI